MLAYDTRCTICLLEHASLLDAAHIIADRETDGAASVTNGVSLCKIHHAAYDAKLLGISHDFQVHGPADLLEEVDGPTLRHGLQETDRRSLYLPRAATDHPDRARPEVTLDELLSS